MPTKVQRGTARRRHHPLCLAIHYRAPPLFCAANRMVCSHATRAATLAELERRRSEALLDQRDLAAVHRILHSARSPACLKERVIYRSAVSTGATRGTTVEQLELHRVRSEVARRSFAFRAVSKWNRATAGRQCASSEACARRPQ